jgi:predicted enzyme related to lactoylglutathione lyase
MDKVVHFEIPAENVKRAQKFYNTVFGWKINEMPELEYTILQTVEVDEKSMMPKEAGAINGGMMKRGTLVKSPVITIAVEDIDKAMKSIEKAGGKEHSKKMAIQDMGFAAYFKDTEGNIIGLFQYSGK